MSTVTIQTDMTVDELMQLIRQLKPIEKQQLLEQFKAELTHDTPPLPPLLQDEPWAQQADASTRQFLALCGSWEDSRSAEQIVEEIYQSRTASRTEMEL